MIYVILRFNFNLFVLQQVHATQKDYQLASSLLGVGVDYAHMLNAYYTKVLFLLSKGMVRDAIVMY